MAGSSWSPRHKPLLVGLAPSKEHGEPLSGRIGGRLALLCDLTLDEYLDAFARINLADRWPISIEESRTNAVAIRDAIKMRQRVVLFGADVARAFGYLPGYPLFSWYPEGKGLAAACPHPSGRNRWWNSRENTQRARWFFQALINSMP